MSTQPYTKSQLACLAVEALPGIEAANRERTAASSATRHLPPEKRVNGLGREHNSAEVAGREFGVSGSLVQRAKRIRALDPALFERVKAGELPLQHAVERYYHQPALPPRSYQARDERLEEIRSMAAQGYHSSQIATKLRIGATHVRALARRGDISLPDTAMGRVQKIDAHRVVENTVEQLIGMELGLKTIDGCNLEVEPHIAREWADSLSRSLGVINRLRRHLWRAARGNQ